ncbi:MAG: S-methyl-5'-thioadenosine phosphorylase, partial [Myxococcales bacterium]|nr:S-methyl-5'-thioadenosine phosphorylase [Myxococcales bacterium]
TDYDCWHESEEDVTVDAVLAILKQNVENAKRVIRATVPKIPHGPCPYHNALENAILTPRDAVSPQRLEELNLLIGKYMR